MGNVAALSGLLEPLYQAALEPARMAEFNRRLASETSSHIAGVIGHDVVHGSGEIMVIHGVDTAWMSKRIQQLDLNSDPWVSRAAPLMATASVINSEDLLPRKQMQRMDIHHDYYRELGIVQQVISVGHYDHRTSITLSICHGDQARVYGHKELGLLQQLTPHWVNTYAIQRRLSRMQQQIDSLEAALERAPLAIFLLDAQDRVLRMSHAAEQLLSTSTLLRLEQRRLLAVHDRVALQQLLSGSSVGKRMDGSMQRRQGQLALHNHHGRVALVLAAHPLLAGLAPQHCGGPCSVLFVNSVGSDSDTNWKATLRELFRLTGAEASLACALHRHADLGLAAQECAISLSTARTRLMVIFDKTGERGQAGLIRLLAAIATT